MILIVTKSILTIKNVAHLTPCIKFNVSKISFYEKFSIINHLSGQIEKMCTFSNLATVFAKITNTLHFSSSTWSESFSRSNQILRKLFSKNVLGFFFNVTLFLELIKFF